jgi:hypothetical protein
MEIAIVLNPYDFDDAFEGHAGGEELEAIGTVNVRAWAAAYSVAF